VPDVRIFHKGQVVATFAGMREIAEYRAELDKLVNPAKPPAGEGNP